MLSPNLLSLYREMIMQNLKRYAGIKFGGHTVKNLRYPDDTGLISENKEYLKQLLDSPKKKAEKKDWK